MYPLKSFRPIEPGVPDLLNWATPIDEGIVLCKDGSLMAGYYFRCADSASSPNNQRNDLCSRVATQLARFDAGWCMWANADRVPSPGYSAPEKSHFTAAIPALIDAERREMFEREGNHFYTEYALIIQYLPLSTVKAKIGQMMYDDDAPEEQDTGALMLAKFKKRLADFQSGLSDLLGLRRMGWFTAGTPDDPYESDALCNYLHFCLTGETIALRLPKCPMYMDLWVGIPGALWTGFTPKLGKKFIMTVTIEGFPFYSSPGILAVLDSLPLSYRWSSRFIFEDELGALAVLKRYWKIWRSFVKGLPDQITRNNNGVTNVDAVKMVHDTEQSMGDARSGLVSFGYYTSVVVLMDEDISLLKEQAQYVVKEIEKRGFAARIEEENANEAWNGSLPGHYFANVRRPFLHSLNLAELLPLSSVWVGEATNPCRYYPENSPPLLYAVTNGSTQYRVNLHVEDLGHTKIYGPTRSGKSTLLALILLQALRYVSKPRPDGSVVPATVTAFDKKHSLYTACTAAGGLHYDIGADGAELVLCPLADLDTDLDRAWAKDWIGTCYELQNGSPLRPEQTEEVGNAIYLLSTKPRDMRSLNDFLLTVQDKNIKLAVGHYASKKGIGHILGGSEDSLKSSNLTVYEIDSLMQMGEKDRIPVLYYLFRRFQKSLTGQPAYLLIDEAHVMFGHEVSRRILKTFLRELAKQNCAVVMATHLLSDTTDSGLFDVMMQSCATSIFLPNPDATMEEYGKFGFNENRLAQLRGAQPKRHYYIDSRYGSQLIELALGPLAKRILAVSDLDTLREVRMFQAKYGRDWPLYWLEKGGVDYERYTEKKPEIRAA